MPETVFRDMGGGDNIPDETWAGATVENVLELLISNIPEEDRHKATDLKSTLKLQRPMHALIERGYLEPNGGLETFIKLDLLNPKTTVHIIDRMRQDYIREAWIKGDKEEREAIEFFDKILERPAIKTLYDTVYPPELPPKPSLMSRLLGKVAFNTPWY